MANLLVPGTIETIFADSQSSGNAQVNTTNPWFQILSVKPIPIADGTTRIRLILSDGRNYGQAMLNTALISYALSDAPLLRNNAIFRVTQYTVNKSKDKKFLLLLNFDKENVNFVEQKVGEPTSLDKETANAEVNSRSEGNSAQFTDSNQKPLGNIPVQTTGTFNQKQANPMPQSHQMSSANPVSIQTANPVSIQIANPAPFAQNQSVNPYGSMQKSSSSNNSISTSTYKQPQLDASAVDESTIHPIASLTPYNNKWTIKARVINKSELKSWSNAKGEGKLFNMTLMDASGEIKCAAFKDVAIMFHPLFEVNKVYIIGKGTIKMANAKWSGMSSPGAAGNNYEMQLEKTTFVRAVAEDEAVGSIPSVKFFFSPISQIEGKEKDSIVDVIGVVKECGEATSIRSKATQKQLTKRDVTVVDLSQKSIKVTLWGDLAEAFKVNSDESPIVAFKNVRVTEFNGKSLSSLSSTTYLVNPDIHDAYELRGWYDAHGASARFDSVSTTAFSGPDKGAQAGAGIGMGKDIRKPLSQWKEELPAMPSSDRGEFFSVTGTIARIKHNNGIAYTACPTEGCNKKVIDIGMGQWKCEKCNQVFSSCNHRYMFTMAINDYSSSIWVNVFDDAGQIIFAGKNAADLEYLRAHEETAFEQCIKDCEHKMAKFRIKAKTDFYQGEQRMRYSLIAISAISFEEECKSMLDVIRQYDSK